MTDDFNAAPSGGEGEATSTDTPATIEKPAFYNSPREAAKALSAARWAKQKQLQESTAQANQPEPETELPPDSGDADRLEAATGEDNSTNEPEADQPPTIEPPRSWTKEAREKFASLPRDTQEYIASREQERDREVRRTQNEAAEHRKALEAERRATEQARQQYEAQLPALMQALMEAQAGEFADIRTVDDVARLAKEDPFRYMQWDASQKRLATVQAEATRAQERQAKELEQSWYNYVSEQNALVAERVPELSDKAKSQAMTARAVDVLHDLGFTDQELTELASGRKALPIFDHRVQLLILDGVKYREARKAASTAAPKAVPPVQRPGIASPKGQAQSDNIQALKQRLSETGSTKDAAALYALRRSAKR